MNRTASWCAILGAASVASLFACGPFFPESALIEPRYALLPPPSGFHEQVRKIDFPASPLVPAGKESDASQPSIDAEIEELEGLLADLPEPRRSDLLRDYRNLRYAMLLQADPDNRGNSLPWDAGNPQEGGRLLAEAREDRWPADLPPDIVEYLRGALAFIDGDRAKAQAIWQGLLQWPEEQRRNRSVWAAWMLARIAKDTSLAEAEPWYRETIRLSQSGFPDPLHLGRSAAGWIARHALDSGNRRDAIIIYANQALAGDRFGYPSLRRAIPEIGESSAEDLDRYARDPLIRNLITASLIPRGEMDWDFLSGRQIEEPAADAWLSALEQAGMRDSGEAVQVAWLAYSAGEFSTAERWLALAPSDSPVANSLRGKLALQRGDVEAADKYFARSTAESPKPGDERYGIYVDGAIIPEGEVASIRVRRALADAAITRLALGDYRASAHHLFDGGYEQDTAYVAERLLSIRELMTLLNDLPSANGDVHQSKAAWLRFLAARRLAREGRDEMAAALMPEKLRPIYHRYRELRAKNDPESLWQAAQIHRALGLELFGTEDFPDLASWGGNFPTDDPAVRRSEFHLNPEALPVPPISMNELFRAARHRVKPAKRFHYRYVAADLAWQAAMKMPRNSERTARVFARAGSWLKDRDPEAADRFYKAMIWRNWSTPLAREADERRWFPPRQWDYDPFAANGLPDPGYPLP